MTVTNEVKYECVALNLDLLTLISLLVLANSRTLHITKQFNKMLFAEPKELPLKNHYFWDLMFLAWLLGWEACLIRQKLKSEDIFIYIFKERKLRKEYACKLLVGWHCFSISWIGWQQNLIKPDETPSGVTCKLFINTDSAVLYSAEPCSIK